MYKHVLVTGGAGFIGSHLVDLLVKRGYKVRILDNLNPQIHPNGKPPKYLNRKAEFILGDVTKRSDIRKALVGMDCVFHLAAAVGVGQSMYEIAHYIKVNCYGTSLLLDEIVNQKRSIKKIIVAGSMSSYGEGLYRCSKCGVVQPPLRDEQRMRRGDFDVRCPSCNRILKPIETSEDAHQNSNSIYAISKKNQEEMVHVVGKAYGIPTVALRYFNVYGPRQSLSNPYNGVAAIFMSRIKNHKSPIINEDGQQTRDFVHVTDIIRATLMALHKKSANYQSFNVGSGTPISIAKVAKIIATLYRSPIRPEISYKFRKLDVRHCFADTKKIKKALGWEPTVSFKAGMDNLINWAKDEQAEDFLDRAIEELEMRGLR